MNSASTAIWNLRRGLHMPINERVCERVNACVCVCEVMRMQRTRDVEWKIKLISISGRFHFFFFFLVLFWEANGGSLFT